MKKLLMAVGLCALFATPGLAGEPAKLTSAQMDKVTAGAFCWDCTNVSRIVQVNLAKVKKAFKPEVNQSNLAAVEQSIN